MRFKESAGGLPLEVASIAAAISEQAAFENSKESRPPLIFFAVHGS